MDTLYAKYIEDKRLSWSDSTLHSEAKRLSPYLSTLASKCAKGLWEQLQEELAPYSRLTTWNRAIDFYQWLMDNGYETGPNIYRQFKEKNRRLFKHVYRRRTPNLSYEQAHDIIQTIPDATIRAKALELLLTGMRYTESCSKTGDCIIGKGNKPRPIFADLSRIGGGDSQTSYTRFWRTLRRYGIKPHDLRKLAATRFYSLGLSDVDMCRVMGWNSFETARSYIAPKKDNEIKEVINGSQPIS